MTIAATIEEAIKQHTPAKRVQLCLQRGRLTAYVSYVQLQGDKTIVYAGNADCRGLWEIAEVEAKHHGEGRHVMAPFIQRIELLDGQVALEITTIEII
jgi:hypothetical protein